jgi:hypothetical protein
MFKNRKFSFLFVILLSATLPLTSIQCTSSEDDTSVLEDELDELGGVESGDMGDLDDLSDLSDSDLEDVVMEDGDFEGEFEGDFGGDSEEFAESELEGDLEGEGFEDFEMEGEEFAGLDEEFDGGGDEFAEFEEGDFSEFEGDSEFSEFEQDEFAEFEDMEGGGDKFAENEEALAKEINGEGDYPVAENAQPQFPEEIMGQGNAPPGDAGMAGGPVGGGDFTDPGASPIPPPGQPLITSETQEISVAEPDNGPEVPNEDLGMADPIIPDDELEPEEPNWIPVVKIKTDPFFRNERLINAVYIARPGDDMGVISDKIYRDDRTKELLSDNPHLNKGIDPGDKVYYNSPNRPDDRSALKIYYSDIGLPPQYYTTEKDDNMRRLGSKLLGFADGWKEVWAINPQVDSKTILPAGLQLKYWTGNEQIPTMEVADVDPKMVGDETAALEDEPSLEGGVGTVEDPFSDGGSLPPEPPLPEAQIAMPEPEPVPDIEPFPEEGLEETPGPAPVAQVQQAQDNSLLTVGALALLVLAGAGLVAIQIKKRKDSTGINPQSLEYTQV